MRSVLHTCFRRVIYRFCDCNWTRTNNHNQPHDWAALWVFISTAHLTVCSYYVTYAFQSESTLYICLNVKELLARNRRDIWSLSDCNGTRTHNHLVRKRTLNHLAKLAKWLSCVLSTYLYGAYGYVSIMSRTCFRVNPHSVFAWTSRNVLLETGPISEV